MVDLSVIVITNSQDIEIPCVRKFESSEFDDYELIICEDEGVSTARNAGVREASADKVVFIDDDATPEEGYLRAASETLADEHAVAGRVVDPNDGYLSALSWKYPDWDRSRYIDYVVGCNMAFRREVFEEVGYFDEGFEYGHEESEFASRVIREFPIYYEPRMRVVHSNVDSAIDYWRSRYAYGASDVYWARKRGKSDREIIKSFLHPKWYYSPDPAVLPVSIIGGLIENLSQIRHL